MALMVAAGRCFLMCFSGIHGFSIYPTTSLIPSRHEGLQLVGGEAQVGGARQSSWVDSYANEFTIDRNLC